MTNEQKQVADFAQQVSGDTWPYKPEVMPLNIRLLRAKLILEEALETISRGLGIGVEVQSRNDGDWINLVDLDIEDFNIASYGQVDLVELADGLADLHYVAYCGTGLAFGIDMEPIFKEVHRSNMSKLWTLKEKLKAPLPYSITNVTSMNPDEMCNTDRCYRVKNIAGKVIKSPSYSPANIKAIIEAQSK